MTTYDDDITRAQAACYLILGAPIIAWVIIRSETAALRRRRTTRAQRRTYKAWSGR